MITATDILATIEQTWAKGNPARLRYLREYRDEAAHKLGTSVQLIHERAARTAELSPLSDLEDQLRRKMVVKGRITRPSGPLAGAFEDLQEPAGDLDLLRAPRRLRDARYVLRTALLLAASGPCMQAVEPMRAAGRPVMEQRISVDRQALRQALAGRRELVEAMDLPGAATEEATYSVDTETMWQLAMDNIYTSSDLPALGTREALQNSVDAIRAAVRAKQIEKNGGRFAVTWDQDAHSLTWDDNGIGMDAATVRTKFLSLGSSGKRDAADSNEAVGGFGIAKAVIIGTSSTFRWEMHTRDNLIVGNGFSEPAKFYKVAPRQGTRLTVFDVDPKYDRLKVYALEAYLGVVERLRLGLGASDLPDVTLVLNGVEVPMMFPRRGGSKVPVDGPWGNDTEVSIKAYRRPPGDRHGAYYIRLGGLFQFAESGYNLKSDYVLDFTTKARPQSRDYPFNAARDAFGEKSGTRYKFFDFKEEVEREPEPSNRDLEDEVYDPESDDDEARSGANEIGEQAAEAFGDEDFQRTLAQAASEVLDFFAEQAKRGPPANSLNEDDESTSSPAVMTPPPGFTTPGSQFHVPEAQDPKAAALELRTILGEASNAADITSDPALITRAVDEALRSAEIGRELRQDEIKTLVGAIDRAVENGLGPGGGGLIQAAAVDQAATRALTNVLKASPEHASRAAFVRRNPFGRLAGLRISRKNYDRPRASRFRKNYAKWIPHLTLWDATLRLMASEARIKRRFKPGFILDNDLNGLAQPPTSASMMPVIYINPDYMMSVIKAHKARPLALAGIIHGIAAHELAHLDGHMESYNEGFSKHRELLGDATMHLIPAIARLAQQLLKLPETPEQKSIADLERKLEAAKARGKGKGKGKGDPVYTQLRRELAAARSDLAAAQMVSARIQAETAAKEHNIVAPSLPEIRPSVVLDAFTGAKAIYDTARLRILAGADEPEIARLHNALRRAAAEVGHMALACVEMQAESLLEALPRAACQPPRLRPGRNEAVLLHDDHGPIAVRTHSSFSPCEAAELKKRIGDWRAHKEAWERTLRLVARHLGVTEDFQTGLLLCNDSVAYATSGEGTPMLYLQPVLLEESIAEDGDANAVAKYLLVCAEHELAHLPRMGFGHNNDFIADREDMGRRTGKIFPQVVEIAEELLRARRPQYSNFEACTRKGEACPSARQPDEHLLDVLAEDPRDLVGDTHDGRKMIIARDPKIPSEWRLTFFDEQHRAADFMGPLRFRAALQRAAEHGSLAKMMPAHIPPQPCAPAAMTEALHRRVRDKDREYIDRAYSLFRASTNMSAGDLERFAASRCGGLAGLSDEPVERNARLLRTPKRDWTTGDARDAMRTVSFNARMGGMPSGRPAAKGCPSKRDIALRRWAKDPDKPSRGESLPAGGRHGSCCGSCAVGGQCESECDGLDESLPPSRDDASSVIRESGFEIDPPSSPGKTWNFSLATDTRELNCRPGVADILKARGHNGSGYDWEQMLRAALAEEDPDAAASIAWDPEADLFAALAPSAAPLRSLARCMRRILDNPDALRRVARRLPMQSFEPSKSGCFRG